MNLRAAWVAGACAGGLVWVAAPALPWPARLLTALLLGPAPVAFMLQAGLTETLHHPFPRIPVYIGSIVTLWTLAALALGAAAAAGLSWRSLGLVTAAAPSVLVWTSGLILAGALIVAAFKAAGLKEAAVMHELIPVTMREKIVFAGLCVSAGVCEEIVFRGFLLAALTISTGSTGAAVLLSSAAFGVLHAHQHAAGAARAAVLGLILTLPVILTGSVVPSMAAHAAIDLIGGLWVQRWLVR